MTKQAIWNKHNYSTEYPGVPIWIRGDANHRGADEFDRKHNKWHDPYEPIKPRVIPHKMWTEGEREYIKENFVDNRNMTIQQLATYFNVSKNSLYNQIQYVKERNIAWKAL